jgi:hypothetical protein
MKLSGTIFIFIFICKSINKYRTPETKIWNEDDIDMDEKWMIIATKRPLESCRKTQENKVN